MTPIKAIAQPSPMKYQLCYPLIDLETMISRQKLLFRLDRLRWLVDQTNFVTIDSIDDNGKIANYPVHWSWPLSGQKCRVDAKTGQITEYLEQSPYGIKVYQVTSEHSLENQFGDILGQRLKHLREHVNTLKIDSLNNDTLPLKQIPQDAL